MVVVNNDRKHKTKSADTHLAIIRASLYADCKTCVWGVRVGSNYRAPPSLLEIN
jgi:hypothetical protein